MIPSLISIGAGSVTGFAVARDALFIGAGGGVVGTGPAENLTTEDDVNLTTEDGTVITTQGS